MSSQVLQPVLKMKVDELFFNWLSEPATQSLLKEYLDLIKNGQYPDTSSRDTQDKSSSTFNGNSNNLSSQKNLTEKKNAAVSTPSSPPSTSVLPSGSSSNTRMTGPNGRAPRKSVNIRKVNHLLTRKRTGWTTCWQVTLDFCQRYLITNCHHSHDTSYKLLRNSLTGLVSSEITFNNRKQGASCILAVYHVVIWGTLDLRVCCGIIVAFSPLSILQQVYAIISELLLGVRRYTIILQCIWDRIEISQF